MSDLDAIRAAAEAWAAGDLDDDDRAEARALLASGDEAALRDRFGARLEFGTAGLRGLFGAGPNRMNRAVVVRTTAGLASDVLAHVKDAASRGVVIGYDGRRKSRVFAEDAACVLAAAGIRAWLFADFAPTPLTAYATGALGAAAGIMVTASHNPPDYNGYKAYAENAAQIIPPVDARIAAAIDAVGTANEVPRLPLDAARDRGLVLDVPDDVREGYIAGVVALAPRNGARPPLTIAYTPLHGVGASCAVEALRRAGFPDVHVVAEQREPDGAFPTVAFPNPEEKGAMDLVLALARRVAADVVLANDPDADRLAVAVPDGAGGFRQLTGNEVGTLLGHHLLTSRGDGGASRLVVTTIVSSPQLGAIATDLGVAYEETLTGFKWIANRAMDLARERGLAFVFGYEEALGYSVGTLVRDKDGIGAAVVLAELAATCKAEGTTLLGRLEAIARAHGLFASGQRNVTMKGADGPARTRELMRSLRASPPTEIAGRAVVAVRDYAARERVAAGGERTPMSLPPSDVLAFEVEGGARVVVRPSGTEPKVKVYLDHREPIAPGEDIAVARARAEAAVAALSQAFAHLG